MKDINTVILLGRATKDSELKFTNQGFPILEFSIAVNRSKKVGDKYEDEVSYFNLTLFGTYGEKMKQYVVKGTQVAVEGELRQERWEKDGQKHSKVGIIVKSLQLIGGKPGGQSSGGQNFEGGPDNQGAAPANNNQFEDDIPF